MNRIFFYLLLSTFVLICNSVLSQGKSSNLKINLPSQSIVGSDIKLRIELDKDFNVILPELIEFEYRDTEMKTVKVKQDMVLDTVYCFIKELHFRCLKSGSLTFPSIKILSAVDTLQTEKVKINVLDKNLVNERDTGTLNELVFVRNIGELNYSEDIFVEVNLNKTKAESNDTIIAELVLYSHLSNIIQPYNILNLTKENLKIEYEQHSEDKKSVNRNGKLYKYSVFLKLTIIPLKKGFYEIDNAMLALKIGFKKESDKNSSMTFLLPQGYKEINIDIPNFEFDITK